MPFSKSHSLPTFQERKEAAKSFNPLKKARWLTTDHIVDQVYCDKLNGLSFSEIVLKFANCQYDGQKKPIGARTASDYISAAKDRLMYDYEADMKELRADIYGKLMAVYNDAVEEGDRTNALAALEKIMKLGGITDKQQTNIQINSDKEGGVTVNFGFSNDNEKEDEIEDAT